MGINAEKMTKSLQVARESLAAVVGYTPRSGGHPEVLVEYEEPHNDGTVDNQTCHLVMVWVPETYLNVLLSEDRSERSAE